MTQLVLNIEQPSILPSLRKVLSLINGVSIAKPKRKAETHVPNATTIRAIMDVKAGKVHYAKDLDDLFAQLEI